MSECEEWIKEMETDAPDYELDRLENSVITHSDRIGYILTCLEEWGAPTHLAKLMPYPDGLDFSLRLCGFDFVTAGGRGDERSSIAWSGAYRFVESEYGFGKTWKRARKRAIERLGKEPDSVREVDRWRSGGRFARAVILKRCEENQDVAVRVVGVWGLLELHHVSSRWELSCLVRDLRDGRYIRHDLLG